jgi:hypothetical protein
LAAAFSLANLAAFAFAAFRALALAVSLALRSYIFVIFFFAAKDIFPERRLALSW